MSKNPDKTIFRGSELKSFSIKEDNAPLYEGSAAGLIKHTSTVPDRAMALAPQITQYRMNREHERTMRRMEGDKEQSRNGPVQFLNIPEPFQNFNVKLHFNNPYWTVMNCDMEGPRFSNDHPDINDYLNTYRRNIEEIEKSVASIKTVSFPNAVECIAE